MFSLKAKDTKSKRLGLGKSQKVTAREYGKGFSLKFEPLHCHESHHRGPLDYSHLSLLTSPALDFCLILYSYFINF